MNAALGVLLASGSTYGVNWVENEQNPFLHTEVPTVVFEGLFSFSGPGSSTYGRKAGISINYPVPLLYFRETSLLGTGVF